MIVARIPATTGKAFVIEHHYSHGIHNGPSKDGKYPYHTAYPSSLIVIVHYAAPA